MTVFNVIVYHTCSVEKIRRASCSV